MSKQPALRLLAFTLAISIVATPILPAQDAFGSLPNEVRRIALDIGGGLKSRKFESSDGIEIPLADTLTLIGGTIGNHGRALTDVAQVYGRAERFYDVSEYRHWFSPLGVLPKTESVSTKKGVRESSSLTGFFGKPTAYEDYDVCFTLSHWDENPPCDYVFRNFISGQENIAVIIVLEGEESDAGSSSIDTRYVFIRNHMGWVLRLIYTTACC